MAATGLCSINSWGACSAQRICVGDSGFSVGSRTFDSVIYFSPQVVIQFIHRLGAVAVLIWSIRTVWLVFKSYRSSKHFVRPAIFLMALVLVQILVGGWTVLSKTAVPIATAHVAIGALIIATSVVLCLRAYRYLEVSRTAHDAAPAAVLRGYKTS